MFDDLMTHIQKTQMNSKQFVKNATAGKHRGLNTKSNTHNVFQSNLGRYVELQKTHIRLFKSPKDVLQINISNQQLGRNTFLFRKGSINFFFH